MMCDADGLPLTLALSPLMGRGNDSAPSPCLRGESWGEEQTIDDGGSE